jgi:hypothetical protein
MMMTKRSPQSLPGELLDLDGQHLGEFHLLVEEFDDATEFGRNLVRHKQHPNLPRLQIGLHLGPELLDLQLTRQEPIEFCLGVLGHLLAASQESAADRLDRPVENRVGRVV